MIPPIEMRVLDRNARYAGLSIQDLMEAAGKAGSLELVVVTSQHRNP